MKINNLFESSDLEIAISYFDERYPKAGDVVGGLTVINRDNVPNQGSISASINDYTILPGIREVPTGDFEQPSTYLTDKEKELFEKIQESKQITPLIVVVDGQGPYILEGGHRYSVLKYAKIPSFPALVVIDKDAISSD